ncbi:hypothetical protein [Sphingosinicella sp. CPCC 101087]|uniref:hypothetical protein n=1 Tax=Sphingosinicella sp. CPCC 101087 TaxID=2497754 RepID=UPI00101DA24B|nr:hypothetical protein [Sphingosinicella sp. CPCC 101087]
MLLMLIAAALQTVPTEAQQLEPLACTAQPNFVTRERFPFEGAAFRFSGTVTADSLQPEDFTPFASVALLQQGRPEELSAVLSVQPSTQRRYDVTLRRLINNELRERTIIGRVPTGSVPFEIEITPDRMIVFRLGEVVRRVPLGDFQPDAIVLGCASGSFQFDNLVFAGRS